MWFCFSLWLFNSLVVIDLCLFGDILCLIWVVSPLFCLFVGPLCLFATVLQRLSSVSLSSRVSLRSFWASSWFVSWSLSDVIWVESLTLWAPGPSDYCIETDNVYNSIWTCVVQQPITHSSYTPCQVHFEDRSQLYLSPWSSFQLYLTSDRYKNLLGHTYLWVLSHRVCISPVKNQQILMTVNAVTIQSIEGTCIIL